MKEEKEYFLDLEVDLCETPNEKLALYKNEQSLAIINTHRRSGFCALG